MHNTSSLITTALAAALAAAHTASALAATAMLNSRSSFSQTDLTACYGDAAVSFSDGGSQAVTDLSSASVHLQGIASEQGIVYPFTVQVDVDWDQSQDFSFSNLAGSSVLQASGSLRVDMQSS